MTNSSQSENITVKESKDPRFDGLWYIMEDRIADHSNSATREPHMTAKQFSEIFGDDPMGIRVLFETARTGKNVAFYHIILENNDTTVVRDALMKGGTLLLEPGSNFIAVMTVDSNYNIIEMRVFSY